MTGKENVLFLWKENHEENLLFQRKMCELKQQFDSLVAGYLTDYQFKYDLLSHCSRELEGSQPLLENQ